MVYRDRVMNSRAIKTYIAGSTMILLAVDSI